MYAVTVSPPIVKVGWIRWCMDSKCLDVRDGPYDTWGEGYGLFPCANCFFFWLLLTRNKLFFISGKVTRRPPYITPLFCQFREQSFYFLQFAEQTIFSSLFAKQSVFFFKKTPIALPPRIIWSAPNYLELNSVLFSFSSLIEHHLQEILIISYSTV